MPQSFSGQQHNTAAGEHATPTPSGARSFSPGGVAVPDCQKRLERERGNRLGALSLTPAHLCHDLFALLKLLTEEALNIVNDNV